MTKKSVVYLYATICSKCKGMLYWMADQRKQTICGECLPDDGSIIRTKQEIHDAITKERLS